MGGLSCTRQRCLGSRASALPTTAPSPTLLFDRTTMTYLVDLEYKRRKASHVSKLGTHSYS